MQKIESGQHTFTKSLDTKDLDDGKGNQEDGNPYTDIDMRAARPKRDRNTSSSEFERQDNEPENDIFPTHGKPPRFVDEAARVCEKGTVDRVDDGEFAEGLGHHEYHDTDNDETDDKGPWTTSGEGTTRSDEETCANSAAYALSVKHLV